MCVCVCVLDTNTKHNFFCVPLSGYMGHFLMELWKHIAKIGGINQICFLSYRVLYLIKDKSLPTYSFRARQGESNGI